MLTTTLIVLFPFCRALSQKKPIVFSAIDEKPFNGYVVALNNDTIKCEFKKPTFGTLKYRPINSTGKFIKPSTEKIKEYYSTLDSMVYESMFIDTISSYPTFLKRLEWGEIKLYEQDEVTQGVFMNGYYSGGSSNSYYYVNKDNSLLREIKSTTLLNNGNRKSRREYLLNLFSDDPELAEKFKNEKDFSVTTLRYYIHNYNLYKSTPAPAK